MVVFCLCLSRTKKQFANKNRKPTLLIKAKTADTLLPLLSKLKCFCTFDNLIHIYSTSDAHADGPLFIVSGVSMAAAASGQVQAAAGSSVQQ